MHIHSLIHLLTTHSDFNRCFMYASHTCLIFLLFHLKCQTDAFHSFIETIDSPFSNQSSKLYSYSVFVFHHIMRKQEAFNVLSDHSIYLFTGISYCVFRRGGFILSSMWMLSQCIFFSLYVYIFLILLNKFYFILRVLGSIYKSRCCDLLHFYQNLILSCIHCVSHFESAIIVHIILIIIEVCILYIWLFTRKSKKKIGISFWCSMPRPQKPYIFINISFV